MKPLLLRTLVYSIVTLNSILLSFSFTLEPIKLNFDQGLKHAIFYLQPGTPYKNGKENLYC